MGRYTLQDNRSTCLKLHWRSTWRNVRQSFKPECRSFDPGASRVDICPCFSMTFFGLQHFTNVSQTQIKNGYHLDRWSRRLPNIGCHGNSIEFVHECTFDGHPAARVDTKTRIWYDKDPKTLQVQNRFRFDTTRANLAQLGSFGSKTCVHQETANWLRCFFRDATLGIYLGDLRSSRCHWLGWDTSQTPPHTFEIILERDLGGATPDERWKRQSHQARQIGPVQVVGHHRLTRERK